MSKNRDRDREAAAMKLATLILEWDDDHPGDTEATMEIPFGTWADLIDLAGQVATEKVS